MRRSRTGKIRPRTSRRAERIAVSAKGPALLAPEAALALGEKICRGRREVRRFEFYLEEEERLKLEVREGRVESLVSARTLGLAVRVQARGGLGLSYTNHLLPEDVAAAVDQALDAARLMPRDPCSRLTEASESGGPALAITDLGLAAIPLADKIALAMKLEAAALDFDPRVKRIRAAEYEELGGRVWLLNSEGVALMGTTTLVSAAVEAVAEAKGQAEAAGELETVHFYDRLDVARIGREAARKAVQKLGARGIASGRYPVVLDEDTAGALLSVLAPAAFADAVDKERSWLTEQRGRRVASPLVTVEDDGLLLEGPGAFPFDDEGAPSRRTTVIREGVLENFLFNTYYGCKTGSGSTGNGLRPAFFLPPEIDVTNWVQRPGGQSREDLIRQVENGLYLTEWFGLHTADPVTGEFSLGASGFRIQKGKLGEPISGIMAAGRLSEVLRRIQGVGDRIKFSEDAGAPALLVETMEISGRDRRGDDHGSSGLWGE